MRAADAERARTYAARMLEDVDRLERLVDNLLAAGRAEAGALDLRPVELDLTAETQRYVDATAPMLAARGFELRAAIEPNIRALADPGRSAP